MRTLFFISGFMVCVLVSGVSLANMQGDEEDAAEVLATEEKIENMQNKIRDAKNRYRRGERQYDRWQNSEDISDYAEVIENVKIFH